MLHLDTIVHPTDFSERSEYAFRLACSLARDHGAQLIVLHVMRPPVIYGDMGVVMELEGYREKLWHTLHELRPTDATVRVEHRLEEGQAAGEILRVADETTADLIVMGTHGRRGLGRLLMGSVAEKVMRRASCPVLTVKSPFVEAAVAGEFARGTLSPGK